MGSLPLLRQSYRQKQDQVANAFGFLQAARYYNSGEVDSNDLNNGEGATNSYVRDIANRMTGWVYAPAVNC